MKSLLYVLALSSILGLTVPKPNLQAAEATSPTNQTSKSLIEAGLKAYKEQDYELAVKKWQQALKNNGENLRSATTSAENTPTDNQITDIEGKAYLALGYQMTGEEALARETVAQAKQQLIKASSLLQAKIFNISGTINLNSGRYEAAIADWKVASSAYEQSKDTTGLIGTSIARAVALQKIGQYRQSLNLLNRTSTEINRLDNPNLKFQQLHNLGVAYAKVGDYPQAETLFDQASKQGQTPEQKAAVSISLGNLILDKNPS